MEIGLVGCGNWGKNILRDLLSLDCRVHVADHGSDQRNRALEMGARSVVRASQQLPDCAGYVLAVPIAELAKEARALLPRGVPIFSEKTLCPTMADADSLGRAGAGGKIFVMHKWEYHNGIHALRDILLSGRLGELQQVRCRREGWVAPGRRPDVFTLLAIHDLTIVRHLLDGIPDPEFALVHTRDEVPISLTAVLGRRPRVVLSIDARHPVNCREITLFGTRATAHLPGAYETHVLIRDEVGEERVVFTTNMPLLDELREFVNYLAGGPEPRCDFNHAVGAARVLDGLRRCAVTEQDHPYLEPTGDMKMEGEC